MLIQVQEREFILVVDMPPRTSSDRQRPRRRDPNGHRRAHGAQELADFLRTRRASLQPEDVGLPERRPAPHARACAARRSPLLAGVGTTWYTWLEQGRDVRASLDVLEAIARALRLTPAERAHLILLGRGEEAAAVQVAGRARLAHAPAADREPRAEPGAASSAAAGTTWPGTALPAPLFGDLDELPRERPQPRSG